MVCLFAFGKWLIVNQSWGFPGSWLDGSVVRHGRCFVFLLVLGVPISVPLRWWLTRSRPPKSDEALDGPCKPSFNQARAAASKRNHHSSPTEKRVPYDDTTADPPKAVFRLRAAPRPLPDMAPAFARMVPVLYTPKTHRISPFPAARGPITGFVPLTIACSHDKPSLGGSLLRWVCDIHVSHWISPSHGCATGRETQS